MEGKLVGNLRTEEFLPVHAKIDGKRAGYQEMIFRHSQSGSLRLITPRLTAGVHTLDLLIDNRTARRSLVITSITVLSSGGTDLNGNGIQDHVENVLKKRSRILSQNLTSYVSPAFVEGLTPDPVGVDLTLITRSGQVNRPHRFNESQWNNMLPGFEQRLSSYEINLLQQLRAGYGRMEGIALTHELGAGHNKWFSRIDLARNEAIGYVAIFEDLSIFEHRTIVWTPYNVLDGGELTIAAGSDLLLGAWNGDWDWQTVTLTIDGQNYSFPAGESHVQHYATAGSYLVHVSHPDGSSADLTVHVKDASLPSDLSVGELRFNTVTLLNVEADLALDAGGEVDLSELTALTSGGSSVRLGGRYPGEHRMAVRMGDTAPVLDVEEVIVVGVSDALRNLSDLAIPNQSGIFDVISPLLITNLPAGYTVKVTIFAGGVTFADGTTVKTFTAADFDANGILNLHLLIPMDRLGAPCHYIEIFDANGQRIYR